MFWNGAKLKKNSIYDFFKFRRGGFEDKVLNNLIYSLGLIVFVYANWSFIFGGKILYGSSFSFQSYPLTVEYFKAISEGLYPFFSWNYGVGFNNLADSQQSLLHPLKILLSITLQSHYRIDTIFLLFHVCLIFIVHQTLITFCSTQIFYESYNWDLFSCQSFYISIFQLRACFVAVLLTSVLIL